MCFGPFRGISTQTPGCAVGRNCSLIYLGGKLFGSSFFKCFQQLQRQRFLILDGSFIQRAHVLNRFLNDIGDGFVGQIIFIGFRSLQSRLRSSLHR